MYRFEILAVSAIVPSILLIWYFHRRDVNPEPGRVVWATFFLGVLTVVPVLLVDSQIVAALGHPPDPVQSGFSEAFLVAAIPEEFFKFLVIWLYASRHKEFDEPMDGIVYGAVASLGFATLENILYVSQGGIGVAIMRAVTAVPGHAFMGAIAGYYVGQAKFNPARRGLLMVQGYLTAMILHGLYDAGLLTARAMVSTSGASGGDESLAGGLLILTFAVFVFEWVWSVRLVRRLRAQQFEIAAKQRAAWQAQAAQQPMAMAVGAPAYGASPYGSPNAPMPPTNIGGFGAPGPQGYGAPNGSFVPAPGYGPGMYPVPPVASTGGGVGAWLQLIFGGLLGTVGGLITLAVVVGFATGTSNQQDLGALIIGTAVIGIAPLAIGLFLFARGVNAMRATAPVPAVAYAAAARM